MQYRKIFSHSRKTVKIKANHRAEITDHFRRSNGQHFSRFGGVGWISGFDKASESIVIDYSHTLFKNDKIRCFRMGSFREHVTRIDKLTQIR
jgi:hypothetical protein